MHNLHFIVVKAETGEDACSEAESFLFDWGNENNWRTMCGAVSENNEIYNSGDGRWAPDEDSDTIEKINTRVQGWILEDGYGRQAKEAFDAGKNVNDFTLSELWSLEHYAKKLHERKSIGNKPFNVLEDFYYEYEYDECGVTHIDGEEGKTWVVFCDMHS